MGSGWYYAHDGEERQGPFSGEQLKEFAAQGVIAPTDTVWKGGITDGVVASLIKNLFVAPGIPEPIVTTAPAAAVEAKPATGYTPSARSPEVEKKGVATAVKGADIINQDGKEARYRMKCTDCGHKDSSSRVIRLTNKTYSLGYYCPKCKRKREVVIRCRG